MRVLITGVPGWLGNRFVEILSEGFEGEGVPNHWNIRCLLMEGLDPSRVKGSFKNKQIEWVTGNVTRPESLRNATKDIDVVFHLVGIIHPARIRDLYEINTQGTKNVLEASIKNGVKRFVFISSNSVGGTNLRRDLLMAEDDPPRPYMNYGMSKYQAECAVKRAQEDGQIETVILRPCWYYGPHQPERQARFFRMIKKGNPIVFGDGSNLRSLSYMDNTCQAMLLAAESEKANGQTYWIADDRPYPTNEIYGTIADLLEVKNFKPQHLPGFSSEAFLLADKMIQALGLYITEVHVAGEMNKDIACSVEKAKRELGYEPRIDLREGMRRSIKWCREHRIVI